MPSGTRRDLGQLLFGSFSGTSVPVELRLVAREFPLGGVTLFARNVEAPEQVAEVAWEIEQLGGDRPAWVSVDQEGGRVARLRAPFTTWPPMAALGRADDEALATRFATALARELRAVGVTLDFAPVLDVLTNPANPVIGDRALSARAETVGRLGALIVGALEAEGVAACGKHFPGHGDTSTDSHHDLPVVEHPPERLREVEFAPFRAAIAAGVAGVMTAHVLVPAIDEGRPATLSPRVVQALLRDELGFDGVIFSDDLEMKAIAARYAVPDAAVQAVAAGCDAVLVCSGDVALQAATIEALVKALEDGTLRHTRVDDALMRLQRAKARFLAGQRPHPGQRLRALRQVVGCEEHQLVAAEMASFPVISPAVATWIAPPRLVAGDRVALVAPASPFAREEFEAGLVELRRLGFEPYYDDRVFARHGYVAGLPALRASALMDAWREPSVRAIVAMRGGYGSAQLLPLLDPGLLRQHPKAFVGYSDTTSLLAWYLQHGVVAFHGPMVEGRLARGPEGYHTASFLGALMQATPLGPLAPEGLEVFSHGAAAGILCGGTLVQLAASLGTPWAFTPPAGAILFLEDVAERPYRLDRLLTQLHQAGVLHRAGAIVLGEFPRCDEASGSVRGREVLRALLHGFPGPVVFGFPSGHTTGPGWTLPFGVRARLVTSPVPTLSIDDPAVS